MFGICILQFPLATPYYHRIECPKATLHYTAPSFPFFLAPQALMKPIKFAQVPYLLYRDYVKRSDVGFLLMLEDWQMITKVDCCSVC